MEPQFEMPHEERAAGNVQYLGVKWCVQVRTMCVVLFNVLAGPSLTHLSRKCFLLIFFKKCFFDTLRWVIHCLFHVCFCWVFYAVLYWLRPNFLVWNVKQVWVIWKVFQLVQVFSKSYWDKDLPALHRSEISKLSIAKMDSSLSDKKQKQCKKCA